MQNEQPQPDTTPPPTETQRPLPSNTSLNHKTTKSQNRDMFGGPWLGVLAFLVVAIALGWGLTKLFQSMLDQTAQTLSADELDHGFDPDAIYLTRRGLLIGRRSFGDRVLAPGKEELPPNAPGRHHWPTIGQYRASARPREDYPDLLGLIERGTRVRLVEVIDDRDNAQTRLLVKVRVLDGPFASEKPVLGMYLESADTEEDTGQTRYEPRADLFERLRPASPPVESPETDAPEQ